MSEHNHHHGDPGHDDGHSHHYILPTKGAIVVGGTLLFLTAVTVWIAGVDLGRFNFFVAMLVATIKGLLVTTIFMNLRKDKAENGIIFAASFMFLAIFFVLTFSDLFFRGEVYVKNNIPFPEMIGKAGGPPKFKRPWVPSPDVIARGKELFNVNCTSCHGPQGFGDGPASTSLNPRPRNFHADVGWKNGRQMTKIFKTLKEGIPGSGMASFATLPAEDRWALAEYVLTFNEHPAKVDVPADFAALGVDPNKDQTGGDETKSVPVGYAINKLSEGDSVKADHIRRMPPPQEIHAASLGAHLYQSQCLQCHGERGQGGIDVKSLGGFPETFLKTSPLTVTSESIKNPAKFQEAVVHGLPGDIMPGYGELSSAEIHELYSHVKSLVQ